MSDPRSEREEEAKRHRGNARDANESHAASVATEPYAEQVAMRSLRDSALVSPGIAARIVTMVLAIAALVGSMVLLVLMVQSTHFGVIVLASIVGLVGSLVTIAACQFMIAKLQLGRVHAFGFGFDVVPYLDALSRPHASATVHVYVRFGPAIDKASQAKVADAARSWMPALASASWDAERDALHLKSAELDTSESWQSKHRSVRNYTNRFIHGCVAEVMTAVVPRLHGEYPIDRVELVIEGAVLPVGSAL